MGVPDGAIGTEREYVVSVPGKEGWYARVVDGQTAGYVKAGYAGTSDNPGDQFLTGMRPLGTGDVAAVNAFRASVGAELISGATDPRQFLSEALWERVEGKPAPVLLGTGNNGVTATPREFYQPREVPVTELPGTKVTGETVTVGPVTVQTMAPVAITQVDPVGDLVASKASEEGARRWWVVAVGVGALYFIMA